MKITEDDYIRDQMGKVAVVLTPGIQCPGCSSRGYGSEKHKIFKKESEQIRVLTCGCCLRKFKSYEPPVKDF